MEVAFFILLEFAISSGSTGRCGMNEIVLLQNKAEQTGEGELLELFLKRCHVC